MVDLPQTAGSSAAAPAPLYIVTGADHTHAEALMHLLMSIREHEPTTRAIVYDLGLSKHHRSIAELLVGEEQVRSFDYGAHPAFFDISVNAGQFAWKPTIIFQEIKSCANPVVWLDAGDLLIGSLDAVRTKLAKTGFFAPSSGYFAKEWTHPAMVEHFGLSPQWGTDLIQVSGGVVALDPGRPKARALAEEWAHLAGINEVIAPAGSDLTNHRQDQALLTVLAHLRGLLADPPEPLPPEILIHQDNPIKALRWENSVFRDELGRLGRLLDQSQQELAEMRRSRSWRVAAPLRAVHQMLRRIGGALRGSKA